LTICGFAAVRVLACGGQIYGNPLGYLDDAGTYHASDGAVLFGPGSACSNYDPSNFARLEPQPKCANTDCNTWLDSAIPPGYPMHAGCQGGSCGAGLTVSANTTPEPYPVYCTPGAVGDAYCSAFLTQFVIGGGRAIAHCVHQCSEISPENGGSPYCASGGPDFYACVAGEPGSDCSATRRPTTNDELCVIRGASASSEIPCAPPPSIADAGNDQDALNDAGEEP